MRFPPRFVWAACAPAAVLTFAVFLAAPVFAQTPPAAVSAPAPAAQVLGTAVKTAKATKKNILVHFGASW